MGILGTILLLRRRRLSLHRILSDYFDYYQDSQAHLSLERNSPNPRRVEASAGKVVSKAYLGGLHHLYTHAA